MSMSSDIQADQEGLPNTYYIEPTNVCNLKCVLCPTPKSKRKKGFMDISLFERIVDQIPQGSVIHLYHSGEPLLHPEIVLMVQLASERLLSTTLSTNGTKLTETLSLGLIESGLNSINFSVDAANAKDYERTRVGSSFGLLLSNISQFLRLRDESGNSKLHTTATMVVTDRNRSTCDEFREKFKEIGIDEPKLKQFLSWGKLVDCGNGVGVDVYDVEPPLCMEPFVKMVILWDGSVVPCCPDCECLYPCGSAVTTSLGHIWNGSVLTDLRSNMSDAERYQYLPRMCKTCEDMMRIRRPWLDQE